MKKLISAALALALTLSLAACGGGGQGSTPNNPGAASSGGSDKPFAGQTLTVLYMSGVYADAARAMVPEFEEATGAKVEVVDFPYLTLHEKALLDLTSQTGSYDVIDVASQWDGEFAPFMEPLDSYIERDNYDMSVWIENVLANCGEWQGTIVGIPNASTPQTFAYRTDLLPDGIPDTWEGYREALAQVNDPANGLYGVTVSEVSGQLGGVFDYVLWSMGGNWADEDWNITIDSPETRAALEHLYAIKDYSDPSNLAWEWIKMYTDYDMQNRFHDEFGILSPRKAFWDQDKMANQKAVRDALDTANMWWRIPASVEADTCINSAVGAYLSDQIDLETCVKQLTDGLTAALSSNPPEDGIKNYNH